MAKAIKKKATPKNIKETKTPKEASALFHNIMSASVKGNPKPSKKEK